MNIEYIDKNSELYSKIKELIKSQGENTCRNEIDKMTIRTSLDGFVFGFVSYSIRANYGRRSPRSFSDKYILNGFVICSTVEYRPLEIRISLLCALKGLSIGSLLLEAVNEYAIKNNFNTITLLALPDKKLISWYKKNGFKEGKNNFNIIKCTEMYKIL
jgi:hypothetical protein